MLRIAISSVVGLASFMAVATSAYASEISVKLPGDQEVEETRIEYDCGAFPMTVDYVNAGPVSLAVFEIDGQPVVASNVISASGARYAGDAFIWWTEGKSASLFDLTAGEDGPPRAECEETPG